MTTQVNANDPRVKRTRQLLLQAVIGLLEERNSIHSISVQEIATRATVNRATFYAHFEDKYVLLESWMREKFHQALERQLPVSSTLQISTLRLLILAVFDFLAHVHHRLKLADRQFEPLFEIAIQQELYEILLVWLKHVSPEVPECVAAGEATALIISWAIFGPATQWSREDQRISKEVMAHHVLTVVIAGLSPIVIVT